MKSIKSKPKKSKREPSQRLRLFIKNVVENGGNKSRAALDAGYSESVAHDTIKITNSEGFKSLYPKVLEKAGLTDEHLAAVHAEMVNAITVETMRIEGTLSNKRKKLYDLPSFEDVKLQVEARYPGRKYTLIADASGVTAYVQVPAHHYRGRGLELAYKSKGHMSPDPGGENLDREATPVEKALIDAILNNNKK